MTRAVCARVRSQNQFTVIQPGSTVATSLVEGEAKPKHVALLSIKDDNWKMESIPLTTVRPFLLREVVLAEHADEYELHDERTLMDMLGTQAGYSHWLRSGQTALANTRSSRVHIHLPALRRLTRCWQKSGHRQPRPSRRRRRIAPSSHCCASRWDP